MTNLRTLADRNIEFAETFAHGGLGIPPRLSTLVLTCLDARVDPAYFFGLELGDAFVIRNVGGRVTDEVIEQMAILTALAAIASGGSASLEVAIVHHTDCGTTRFTIPEVRQELSHAAGTDEAAIGRLATTDPADSVAEDVQRLSEAPTLPDTLIVAGYVYDVTDGRAREIVAPAPLRG